jgi:hypothetical protein
MKLSTTIRTFVAGVLLAASSAAQAIIPENGWWYVEGEAGRGFNLEVQNTFLYLASFGYDASGNPQWLVAGANMTSDHDWSATLLEFSRGWCYGCPPVTPTYAESGTVSLAFTSSQTATMVIKGHTYSIRRFDMWRNDLIPDAMLGEWSAVIGTAGDTYDGERIEFGSRLTDSLGAYLSGTRMGSAAEAKVWCCTTDGWWQLRLDSSTTYWRYFEFQRAGFNRVEGYYWLVPKGQNPSGSGTFFQAFRTASYAFTTTGIGPASSKSAGNGEALRARQERIDQVQFERQAARGGDTDGGLAARFEAVQKIFGK